MVGYKKSREGHELRSQGCLGSYGLGRVILQRHTHIHTQREKEIERCKFKLIRRDHVGFIKSMKLKDVITGKTTR